MLRLELLVNRDSTEHASLTHSPQLFCKTLSVLIYIATYHALEPLSKEIFRWVRRHYWTQNKRSWHLLSAPFASHQQTRNCLCL